MQLTSFLFKAFALSALAAPLASAGRCRPKSPGKYPDGGHKDTPTYKGGDSYYPTNGGGNGYPTTPLYNGAYPTTFVTKTSQQGNKWKTWDIQNTTTVYNSNSAGVITTTTTTTTTATVSLPGVITPVPGPTDGFTTTITTTVSLPGVITPIPGPTIGITTTTTPILDAFPTSTLTLPDPGPTAFPTK